MKSPAFELVVLCTANRFRSPLAAAVIEAEGVGVPLRIRSLAASGPSGLPPLPQALVRAGNLNLDLAEHQATRIERGGLASADLVVGFERSHVAAAVIEGGAARERAFTLPEFVPLAENVVVEEGRDPVERARLVVRAAAAARSTAQGRALPELRDPAGGPERGYDAVAAELVSLSRRLVRALFGAHAS